MTFSRCLILAFIVMSFCRYPLNITFFDDKVNSPLSTKEFNRVEKFDDLFIIFVVWVNHSIRNRIEIFVKYFVLRNLASFNLTI